MDYDDCLPVNIDNGKSRACRVSISFETLQEMLKLPEGIKIYNVDISHKYWKGNNLNITLEGDGLDSKFEVGECEEIAKGIIEYNTDSISNIF